MKNTQIYTIPGLFKENDKLIFVTETAGHEICELLLIDPDTREVIKTIPMKPAKDSGSALVRAEVFPWKTKWGYLYKKGSEILPDPYARLIKDGLCFVPEGAADRNETGCLAVSPEDLVIYKLHVRGLTKGQAKLKDGGTYKALCQKLPYISGLGFTAIELMPAYAWDEALKESSKKNYWGYSAKNYYFSPNPRFAATGDPVKEFKNVICEAHNNGLAVIMEFFFPGETVPFTGWLALRYWKEVYCVDGFHIIGNGMPHDLILSDPYLSDSILIFDGTGEDLLIKYRGKAPTGVYFENEDFRMTARATLKGEEGQMSPFVHKTLRTSALWTPVNDMANVNGFTLMDAVSYESKHNEENGEGNCDGSDHNVTWNCGAEGPTGNRRIRELRLKQVRNALSYVFLAQGTPLVYAGDESGNTQNGNNNAYCLDCPAGWVDSGNTRDGKNLRSYVKDLISFRKRFRILHKGSPLKELSARNSGYPEVSFHGDKAWYYDFGVSRRTVGILYDGRAVDGCFLYVIYNASVSSENVALPPLPDKWEWTRVLDTGRKTDNVFPDSPEAVDSEKYYEAAPMTVTVLMGREPQKRI